MPNNGAVDLSALSAEDKERLDEIIENTDAEIPDERDPITTAFVVLVDLAGRVMASSDVSILNKVTARRPATADDIYGACSVIMKDISVQETAAHVQMGLMQQAQAMQRQMQDQQLLSGLKLPR